LTTSAILGKIVLWATKVQTSYKSCPSHASQRCTNREVPLGHVA
jgi:hypothetical protein